MANSDSNIFGLFFQGCRPPQKIHVQTLSAFPTNFTFLNPKFIHGDLLLTGETLKTHTPRKFWEVWRFSPQLFGVEFWGRTFGPMFSTKKSPLKNSPPKNSPPKIHIKKFTPEFGLKKFTLHFCRAILPRESFRAIFNL